MRKSGRGNLWCADSSENAVQLQGAGLLAFVVTVSVACGSNESPVHEASVTDSAGVMIVESMEPLWRGGGGWRLSRSPELSIGVVDGEATYLFDGIVTVRVGPAGHIYVADAGSSQIRVFDSSGQHLLSFGGPGEGPGEFRDLSSMVMVADTIFVLDNALRRLTAFDESGTVLETTALESTGDPIHPLRLYGLAGTIDGDLVFAANAFPADMRPEPVVYWDSLPTLRYDRNGALRDTIGEYGGMDTYSTPQRAGSITFARFSSGDLDGDRLYMTDGGDYEVRVYGPGGDTECVLRVSLRPRPVSEPMLDAYFEAFAELAPTPEVAAQLRARKDTWEHRETLPWLSRVVVSDGGEVWVREYQDRFDRSPDQWGVFDEDGQWLGRVELADGFTPTQIGSGFVLGIARDELQVEYVHRYSLDRG